MAKLNVTIDDSSPLIMYQGNWTQVQVATSDAYRGTYSSTQSPNSSATVEFNGTSITVYGSKNKFHGRYTVTLDNKSYKYNGRTKDTPFTEAIFTSKILVDKHHTLVISNDEWAALDIDSITWSCNIGPHNASNSSLLNVTTDDSASAFTWLPQGSWDTNLGEGTLHSTSQVNASVNYTFSGNAVSIYGTTGPENSRYSVSRADQPPKEFTANRNMFSSQVLLYFGQNFGSGMNHTVTLVNETPGLLQIDYAVVHTANVSTALSQSSSSQPTSSQSSPPPTGTPTLPPDPPSHKGLSTGATAAISVAAVLFVLLLVAVWLLLRRNKTLWMRLQRGYMVQSQFDVYSPPNGVTPLIYTDSSPLAGARTRKGGGFPANDDESFEARSPILDRAVTMQSQFSASTLVADAGSDVTQVNHGRLKPLHLATRWASSTLTTSQASFSPSARRLSGPRLSPSRHLSHSPSTRHLLREDTEYYDPHAAAMPGLPEASSEDRVDDILHHPIRRNEPPTYQWQAGLP